MRTGGQGPGGFEEREGSMSPGQDLVAAGYIGSCGTLLIGRRKRRELEKRFSPKFLRYLDGIQDTTVEQWIERELKTGRCSATAYEYAGEGGVLAALWNLSGIFNVGIDVDLRALPLHQITVEICELYGLNPYRLYCGGCVIMAADHGMQLVRQLAAERIPSAVIGSVTQGVARRISHGGENAGFLERPRPDELYNPAVM